MNSIDTVIKKCEQVAGRYVGDLNLLTLAAFNCNLRDVRNFTNYSKEQVEQFNYYLEQFFNTDIPTAYIVGFELFLDLKILVNQHTLIPRFETEELVINLESRIKLKYKPGSKISIVDICSGSGVIGVSLYKRLEAMYEIEITFVDISREALDVTLLNCQQYGIEADLILGDMAKPLIARESKFDVIVSNPPYIDYLEDVQSTVLSYEPKLALYANDNGLALYKSLINDIIEIGNQQFCLMLEIGESQAAALNQYLLVKHGYEFEVIKDINGSDRNLYLEV